MKEQAADTHQAVVTPLRRIKGATPKPVKSMVREVSHAYGLATADRRPDPDFIVIGTKRGGTTSLWNALVRHDDVLPMFPALQEAKSPHYFDLNYGKGSRWYRSHFPSRRARARHEARTGRRGVTGEASPYYMFHPLAAQRISRDLPDVKLIVSLRNPIDRAWSHYRERLAGGTEELGFRQALEAEHDRLSGERERIIRDAPGYNSYHHEFSSYLARGRYREHLEPFVDLFGDRLLILRAEDFYTDENRELSRISQFLGLAPYPPAPVAHYNKMPSSQMSDADRSFLQEYYSPHVTDLEQWLGRSMDWADFRA